MRAERRVARPARGRPAAGRDHPEQHDHAADREQPERERVQARERHVGRADHQRDHEVAEAREDRDDDGEDHQRRVLGDEHVEGLRVEVLVARLSELGPEEHRQETADDEERHRRDEVLDPDHLVVGVRAEVVLPLARAVPRVVLRPRRAPREVVGPVVERTDADQEADREGDRRDGDEGDAVPDRIPVRRPADQAGEPEAREADERGRPQRAPPAGRREAVDPRRRRWRRVVAVAVRGLDVMFDCGVRHGSASPCSMLAATWCSRR